MVSSASSASSSTSHDRAVFTRPAPSGIRASCSAPIIRWVSSVTGACTATIRLPESSVSSGTDFTPSASASASERNGSVTLTRAPIARTIRM